MSDNYDEIDELMDWEEMDSELVENSQRRKPTGCCLLPCLSLIALIGAVVGLIAIVI